jgi:predicted RNase H-like HicB family nuclease
MTISLKHIIWQEGEHYVAQCLNVDVSSFGNSKENAIANLKEALELYFEDMPVSEIQLVQNPEIVTTSFEHA